MKNRQRCDVLLALLPFWTPQIPPLGISCLKSFLQPRGFRVKTLDLNIDETFSDIYFEYFNMLKQSIPGDRRGNFYNIGNDVLRSHLMAHLHRGGAREDRYVELVKIPVQKTFYHDVESPQVLQLDKIIEEFYVRLETRFLGLLEAEKPSVLGLSVYSGTLPASLFVFRLVKERYPHIRTVMGGGIFADQLHMDSPGFEFFLEKTPYIDHIVIGEGERLFLKLLGGELPASQRVFTLKDIGGETLDLAAVDIPDFSDLNLESYASISSYVSRSCPYQCAFCSETLQWGKYRKKSPARIVEESAEIYQQYGSQLFLLGDSLLNPVITGMAEEFIRSGFSIYWDGYLRADAGAGKRENTMLWRRGGFYRARLGVESGSQRVLESMGKKIAPGQIKSAISALAYAGIKTTTYWVIGHPGETEADFRQTLDLIEELKSNIYEAECNPFNYFLTGQINSNQWAQKYKALPLYPETAKDMLVVQTWTMDCEPSREETYRRVGRFVEHCKKLGIPNPYSINEINRADRRWQQLHKNAVPPLVDFKKNHAYIDESKHIKEFAAVQNIYKDQGEDNEDFDL
jgi:radical SAM superfamily enzyme YgiQ (UPF0313 family)